MRDSRRLHLFVLLGTDAFAYDRAVLLAVCRQGRAHAEGLVQQPVFQNVDDWLVHRSCLHAFRDIFHTR